MGNYFLFTASCFPLFVFSFLFTPFCFLLPIWCLLSIKHYPVVFPVSMLKDQSIEDLLKFCSLTRTDLLLGTVNTQSVVMQTRIILIIVSVVVVISQ